MEVEVTSSNSNQTISTDPVDSLNEVEGAMTTLTVSNQKYLNILLLGQTGVGKSTFINGFANYLQFEKVEEAEAWEGLISPVPSQFVLTDDNFDEKKIVTGTDENESTKADEGESATQNAKAHIFPYGDILVRLIDTPGIGDTRGVTKDKENFKQILSCISNYDELHGICILLKPNESKLDTMFRFCIQELLTYLHKSATANMIFCFTNARSTCYKPGDTMVPLRALLKQNGLTEDIKIGKEIVYCVDNEAFRYLAALKDGISFNHQDKALFATSWVRSRATAEDMVNYFRSKDPHKVKNTLSLCDTRRMIIEITKPLADMTKHIQTQISDVKTQQKEVEMYTGNIKDLKKKLCIKIKDLDREPLGFPCTVCTSTECTSHIETGGRKKYKYEKHCHPQCYLKGVVTDTVDNPDLRRCAAMDEEGTCKVCKCSWNKHMHITYVMKEVEKESEDMVVKDQLKQKNDIIDAKKLLIEQATKKIEELKEEKRVILKTSAKFDCFLKETAIIPYNDAMIDYINLQIKEERDNIGRNMGSEEKLLELEETKRKYEEEIKILDESLKFESPRPQNPEQMKYLLNQLFELPNFGANLKKIYNSIESERKRRTYEYDSVYTYAQPRTRQAERNGWRFGPMSLMNYVSSAVTGRSMAATCPSPMSLQIQN